MDMTIEEYRSKVGRKKKAPTIRESIVVSDCIKWLHINGCFIWRNNTGAYKPERGGFIRYGKVGSPDILGMTPSGRFIGVECKSGSNDLTEHQEHFRDQVLACNGLYIAAWSVDDLEAIRGDILP